MGLSNEERFAKISWSIHHIVEISEQLKDNYHYGKLKKLILELWPSFLGNSSNSTFWIFGGDLDGRRMSGNSLVSLAFEKHYAKAMPKDGDQSDEDSIEEREEKEGVPYHKRYNTQQRIREMLSMETLINDSQKRAVLLVFQHSENISYALKRYNDEFSEGFKELNKVLRMIQGELFDIFQSEPDYYRVWLLNNIIKVAANIYQESDLVMGWICKQNIHHDLRLMFEHKTEELQAVWKYLQPLSPAKVPVQQRLLIVLALAGRRYYYEHQYKELRAMIKAHNEKEGSEIISLESVEEVLKWCVEQHKLYEEDQKDRYRPYCHLFNQEC